MGSSFISTGSGWPSQMAKRTFSCHFVMSMKSGAPRESCHMSCDLSLSASDCGGDGGGGGGGGDGDNDDDDDDATLDVLANDGDDSIISLLPRGKREKGGPTIVALRRYDDEVRTLAVSPNGLRIAVGFDDGSTKV